MKILHIPPLLPHLMTIILMDLPCLINTHTYCLVIVVHVIIILYVNKRIWNKNELYMYILCVLHKIGNNISFESITDSKSMLLFGLSSCQPTHCSAWFVHFSISPRPYRAWHQLLKKASLQSSIYFKTSAYLSLYLIS